MKTTKTAKGGNYKSKRCPACQAVVIVKRTVAGPRLSALIALADHLRALHPEAAKV